MTEDLAESFGNKQYTTRRQFLRWGSATLASLLLTDLTIWGGIKINEKIRDNRLVEELAYGLKRLILDPQKLPELTPDFTPVNSLAKQILPVKENDGGLFLFWKDQSLIFSEHIAFPQGSLIKTVLAAEAIKTGVYLSEKEWHELLIDSSDPRAIELTNRLLQQKGISEPTKEKRIEFIKNCCQRFGMFSTDHQVSCLGDYSRFWQKICSGEILEAEQRQFLLKRMLYPDINDIKQRFALGKIANLGGLILPEKIGLAQEQDQVIYSAILAVGKECSQPTVIGGCFFRSNPKEKGKAFERYIQFHRLAVALGQNIRQSPKTTI